MIAYIDEMACKICSGIAHDADYVAHAFTDSSRKIGRLFDAKIQGADPTKL
jgi:hypothetical protein